MYNLKEINQIDEDLRLISSRTCKLYDTLLSLDKKLTIEKAREYLQYGVMRRVGTLKECISNVFSTFPVDKKEILEMKGLSYVTINLQTLFVNIVGVLDNLAWVINYEKNLGLNKMKVCLFKKSIKDHLGKDLKEYLQSDPLKTWLNDYFKSY